MNAVAKGLVVEILKTKGGAVNIAEDLEILAALASVKERWEQIRAAADEGGPATVIELIETLAAQADDGPLVKLLVRAGLDGMKTRAALAKVTDVFGKIDPQFRPLLRPVVDFDEDPGNQNIGLVEWKVVGIEEPLPGAIDKLDYSIDLGGHASLQLEAGDTWPADEPSMPDPLLRIGFVGGLSVSAKAALPVSFGSLQLGAAADREAAVDYYFDVRESGGVYARAVVDRLGELPDPWSLESVLRAMQRADFAGAVIETQGGSTFSVEVAVAEAFALEAELDAQVGVTVGAKVTRRGNHYVRLRALPASAESAAALEVTIERKRSTAKERALEVGVDVDAAELGRRLARVLQRHEGKLHEVLDPFREFLTPGTYLRTQAGAHLAAVIDELTADAALRAALKDAARRALGLEGAPSAANLKGYLEDEIAELFDGTAGVVGGAIDGVAREIAAALTEKALLPAEVGDALVTNLVALIEQVRGDLKTRVEAVTGASASKLVKRLDAAGVKVAAAGNRADNIFAAVTEVIGRYELALDRLRKAVTDAARMRLTAKITAEGGSVEERSADARLIFKADSAGARRIYRRVLGGDFDTLLALLDDLHPDVIVDREATTLSAFKRSARRTGYELVLLGFEVGGAVAFDTASKLVVEGSGKVSVISKLSWDRRRATRREAREISFVDSYELAAARHTRDLRIDLALQHEDEHLKRREVEKLIERFERALLVPAGTTARALAVFDEWFGTGDVKIAADIDFALRLSGKAVLRLLCLAERTGDALSAAERRRIFGIVLQELVTAGVHEQAQIAKLANFVHTLAEGTGTPSVVDVLFAYTAKEHRRLRRKFSPSVSSPTQDLDRAHLLHERCMSFVDLIDRMGDVYEATPSIAGDGTGWSERDYDAAQVDIANLLRGWLKTSSRVFWISAEAHPLTVAFISALTALAEVDDGPSGSVLAVSMTRRTLEPVTVTLC
jgi:hypothetical protein